MRTTSALEGYKSGLCTQIPTHGNFWDFLKVLKQEEFQKYNELTLTFDGVYDVFESPKKRFKNQSYIIEDLTAKLYSKKISLSIFLQSMTNRKNNIMPNEEKLNFMCENEEIEDAEDAAEQIVPEGLLCEICFQNKKNILLKPCKHGKICRVCFENIRETHLAKGTLTLCPICRQIVGSAEEFFI